MLNPRPASIFHFDNRLSFALNSNFMFNRVQEIDEMNTQTLILTVLVFWLIMGLAFLSLILTVLVFWLIMGLAFLSAYSEVKRTGGTLADAMRNNESFFFIISIVVGLVVVAFKLA
jgi:hypothetical protein